MAITQLLGSGFRIAEVTFVGAAQQSSTTSATKTVSTSIGTARTDRYVIVYATLGTSGAGRSVSSATINGVAATIAQNLQSTSVTAGLACFFALVPTGTTPVTITAVLSGTTTSSVSNFHVYTLTGRSTLSVSGNADGGGATSATTSNTITPPVFGFSMHLWGTTSSPSSPTWSGTITPTQQGAISLSRTAVTDVLNANGGTSVTTTHTTATSIGRRLVTTSFAYR
jgi:hypothetical protein